jgi:glycosyltransferase involved in cell wall biosynthesis
MSTPRPKVVVLTNSPSYHQVDLFDAIAADGLVDLKVLYQLPLTKGRQWATMPEPNHPHCILPAWFASTLFHYNDSAIREIRAHKPDLVIVTQYSSLTYQTAMYYLSLARIPWVFWTERMGVKFFEVERGVPDFVVPWVRSMAFWPAKKFARQIWGIGASAQKQLAEVAGAADRLPYYSDLTRFEREPGSYLKDGTLRFLYAGRYSFRKGFDTLVDAVAKLVESHADANWSMTLCGDGDMKGLLDEHREFGDRVRNLGFKELAEVPDVMKAHDVFVTPSRYDGWGMVVPEALAAGMPVVATTAMGSATDVEDDQPCLTRVPPAEPAALYDALRWFVENQAQIPDLGRQAHALSKRYDSATGAQRFVAMVVNALS